MVGVLLLVIFGLGNHRQEHVRPDRAVVLVQPEMERWRFPLASIPPFGRGFSRHRYDHQAIPQHGCVPAEPASVSPGNSSQLPVSPSSAKKYGLHFFAMSGVRVGRRRTQVHAASDLRRVSFAVSRNLILYFGKFIRCSRCWNRGSERRASIRKSALRK